MQYNAIVIGGGTAGLTAARLLARSGLRVAIIEANVLGGECVYTGCVPSKTLLYTAKMLHQARYIAPPRGIQSAEVGVDFPAVLRYVHEVSDRIAAWQTASLKPDDKTIAIYSGTAVLQDAHT